MKRVISKLAGWKAKFLYFTGRAVLIKSVMSVIPNYVMQGAALPVHVCEKLDKLIGTFYGATNEKRRMHMMG